MKGIFFAICCLGVLIYNSGCNKSYSPDYSSCTPVQVDQDTTALLKFAHDHYIKPTRDSSGLYYEIVDIGSGLSPIGTSRIFVTYVGKLMDGTTFDSVGNAMASGWVLNTLIEGWQIGLPKIAGGG